MYIQVKDYLSAPRDSQFVTPEALRKLFESALEIYYEAVDLVAKTSDRCSRRTMRCRLGEEGQTVC